ncbi:divalent metal cation transporter [Glaciibacter flavus]|uniref:Divalent metal cation transporter n=2 Tax=Orlajensenia flava TaxID=2565934 RepID=A0A4S4FST5_9MICO|nr:divalent metal cation transporter [Glaciibacter flavus]
MSTARAQGGGSPAGPASAGAASATRAAWMLGPALVAGVAYLDPGNVASNMTAGARYGYLLVWVVVLANVMAWLIQYLSAKLGVVTGQSLPQLLGTRIRRRPARIAFWLQAELVAMATDIAEVIGGAVALNLLFDLPLVVGGLITGLVSIGLLAVQSRRGPRTFEFVIIGLLVVIAVGFSVGVLIAPPDAAGVLSGLVPRFTDADSVLLAASILGATIMPHAIYAHSALARDRWAGVVRTDGAPGQDANAETPLASPNRDERRSVAELQRHSTDDQHRSTDEITTAAVRPLSTDRLLRATRWDVSIAMIIAGTVNLCILLLAAANLAGVPGTDSLEGAYRAIADGIGPVVATLFAVGLLASGLASTSVGAYAGAEIMQGLLRIRLPMIARRLITLIPAIAILALGFDPTRSLVISQVVLSFGIPFALIPLVWLTSRPTLLGRWSNRRTTTAAGILAAVFLIGLNATLLALLLSGPS